MSATLPRPGSVVRNRTAPPAKTVPTDVGTAFWTGITDRGPLVPVAIRSLQDFTDTFGDRQTYSVLYDSVEYFFKENGSLLWLSRVVGPAAAIASLNLLDSGAGTSLVVKAKGPGAYANGSTGGLKITVTGTGPFVISVKEGSTVVETSPSLADQAAAVDWARTNSKYIDISLGATALLPVAVADANLAGGDDDRASITDAQWVAAQNRFPSDLGPGQICQVGRTTDQAHADMLSHAKANNRWAVCDLPDSATYSTLKTSALAKRTSDGKYGFGFGPWVVVPGLIPGTTRLVPPSVFVCAKIAQNAAAGKSPNAPSAGNPEGILINAIGLSQPAYDSGSGVDVTRDDMYSAGVNLIVYRYGVFQLFGWRSFVDPAGSDVDWLNAGNGRLAMAIQAKASAIAENYILKEIDGQGRLLAQFKGDLIGMLKPYWEMGSLYGATPEDAFAVDVGPNVNTPATIANRELHAVISVRMSQDAEIVLIDISKIPTDQNI